MIKAKGKFILILVLLIVALTSFMLISGKQQIKKENTEQFKSHAKLLSEQFDDDLKLSDGTYDFVEDYVTVFNGSLAIVDQNKLVLYHINEQMIGNQVPIPEINEHIDMLLSDDSKSLYMTYEFNGDTKLMYLHKANEQVIFLITVSESDLK